MTERLNWTKLNWTLRANQGWDANSLLWLEVKICRQYWERFQPGWKVTQSCLTLCNPMDYTVHGILKARLLEWVRFPFSRGSSQPRNQTRVSCIAGGFFTNWAIWEASTGVVLQKRELTWEDGHNPDHIRILRTAARCGLLASCRKEFKNEIIEWKKVLFMKIHTL